MTIPTFFNNLIWMTQEHMIQLVQCLTVSGKNKESFKHLYLKEIEKIAHLSEFGKKYTETA